MKSIHLALTILGCALLTHATGFADQVSRPVAQPHSGDRGDKPDNSDDTQKVIPPDRGTPHSGQELPEKGKLSGKRSDNSGASDKSDTGSHAKNAREMPKGRPDESRREKAAITQGHSSEKHAIASHPESESGKAGNPPPHESNKPVGVAKQDSAKRGTDNHCQLSNPQTAASVGGQPPAAHSRGSGQAVIGGTMRSMAGNTATINGNGIKRSLKY